MLDVKVYPISPIRCVMLKRFGSYDGISDSFNQLFEWVEAQGVPVQRTIGIYWDNPDFVQVSRLRSAACVEVPQGFQLNDRANLPLLIEEIPGGDYATVRYTGPYEDLARVWSEMTEQVEGSMGRRISENKGAFEVYVNDAETTPPSQLVTELFMPLV